MALVFQRRLVIPLWAVMLFGVALTGSPAATVLAIAAVGIAAIVFLMPSAAITLAAGTDVRTLDEANRNASDDALDLVRMDDDGGWQMSRPPA